MIKWTLALLAALVLAGTASAGIVNFNALAGLPTNNCDATFSHNAAGCVVGDVTFWYQDNGDSLVNGSALINTTGIAILAGTSSDILAPGHIGGALTMQLLGPVFGGVTFSFTVASPDAAGDDIIVLSLNNTESDTQLVFGTDLVSGAGTAVIPYPTGSWTVATLTPLLVNNANGFFISAVTTDMPEPASYTLLGTGLLLMVFGQRRLARRKS